MLALPAETADARRPLGLQHRDGNGGAAHFRGLRLLNSEQRRIAETFYEAVAQRVGGEAEGVDGVGIRRFLDDFRIEGPRMDERATRGFEELVPCAAPRPVFGNLAGTARDDVLMAFPAALRIVDWAQSITFRFRRLENEPVVVERSAAYGDVFLVQGVEGRALFDEPVRQIVEAGRRLLNGPGRTRGHFFTHLRKQRCWKYYADDGNHCDISGFCVFHIRPSLYPQSLFNLRLRCINFVSTTT